VGIAVLPAKQALLQTAAISGVPRQSIRVVAPTPADCCASGGEPFTL